MAIKLIKFYSFLLVLLPCCLNAQSLEDRLEFILDSTYQANEGILGFCVHVESPDKSLSWSSARGFTKKGSDEKLHKDQSVLIASNTKTYVSATILKLVENGHFKLDQAIEDLVSVQSKKLLLSKGYAIDEIQVKHLLSHSSGITDYVDDNYFTFVHDNPHYQWTREEQIKLGMELAKPVKPGTEYAYADINYLFLTEIIEGVTGNPFYISIRELLEFKKHGLNSTWFVDLETPQASALPLASQYSDKFDTSSVHINPSWDLYGGGGIVSNAKDQARFFQLLFEGAIIQDQRVLSEIYTYVLPVQDAGNYCLGLMKLPQIFGQVMYYHGGFWGTDTMYLPELKTSISIYCLERENRDINLQINALIVDALK